MKKVMTEQTFEKMMEEKAKNIVSEGYDLEQIAYDFGESLLYDPEIREFLKKFHPELSTRNQKITFVAEYLNL